MAEFFELDLMDLLPRKLPRGYEIGAPFDKGPQSNLVAGAGFEPATSGLWAWWFVFAGRVHLFFLNSSAVFLALQLYSFLFFYLATLMEGQHENNSKDGFTSDITLANTCSSGILAIGNICLFPIMKASRQSRLGGKNHYDPTNCISEHSAAHIAQSTLGSGICALWLVASKSSGLQHQKRPQSMCSFNGQVFKTGHERPGTHITHQYVGFSLGGPKTQNNRIPQWSYALSAVRYHPQGLHPKMSLPPRWKNPINGLSLFSDSQQSWDCGQMKSQLFIPKTSRPIMKQGGQLSPLQVKETKSVSYQCHQSLTGESTSKPQQVAAGCSQEILMGTYQPDGLANLLPKYFQRVGHYIHYDIASQPPPTTMPNHATLSQYNKHLGTNQSPRPGAIPAAQPTYKTL